MHLAYTTMPGRGDAGMLFFDLAKELTAQGARVAGLVQIDPRAPDSHPCDMDLRVLPDGPEIRVSQSLGAGSRGCRLDTGALEMAAAAVGRSVAAGADLLIVNKFGKLESQGRGLCGAIAEAIGRDIPVIVGVNDLNLEAFLDFSDGLATALLPRRDVLMGWVRHLADDRPVPVG
ncbi:nucleoside-triphosphatase THEP1 [Rhodovulum iodosum]|uniref:Nucleoside-triphosphatase THEP1 n=1 Tax=Rhodovulum iodosum TaxID=68291 RepID=A0ABV3XS40_9RHOB|nr:DUF2478 domain-containing protein [Rhodovulum robiginosum]RSK30479.1 DUF2478 domain-containing protein [Rhodovulum robiginosum]